MRRSDLFRASVAALILCTLAASRADAWGGAPDWLKALAKQPLPAYAASVRGVELLDETTTTVTADGEVRTRYRRAWRILNTNGRDLGFAGFHFDTETRILDFHAWSISPTGEEYQLKEHDAVESAAFDGELYADEKIKVVKIPAADPGSVVAFEYEQRRRPLGLQDTWSFQGVDPVRSARYTLVLPDGWKYDERWFNFAAKAQHAEGNTIVWELADVPAVDDEPGMPARRAVEGRMSVNLIPPEDQMKGRLHRTWNDVGLWYSQLISDRRAPTQQLGAKVTDLTAARKTQWEKIRAVASFAQRDVRYVAIEIGIGGYQPHRAGEIAANRYGDCKDKVTVLSAMLQQIGVDSYYVLVNDERGVIDPDFASLAGFDHVIIAIRLPADAPADLQSVLTHPSLGKLLLFDPTSSTTRLGELPPYEQEGRGLLVTDGGGELITLPAAPPSVSQQQMAAKLTLDPAGALDGDVIETSTGAVAAGMRAVLAPMSERERAQYFEKRLSRDFAESTLRGLTVDNLDDLDAPLVLRFHLSAPSYAKRAASLLLVRPRVLGRKAEAIVEPAKRQYPYDLWCTSVETDDVDIAIPEGFVADELPPPQHVSSPLIDYTSALTATGGVLHYHRQYTAHKISIPPASLGELKTIVSTILADERAQAILKKNGS